MQIKWITNIVFFFIFKNDSLFQLGVCIFLSLKKSNQLLLVGASIK